MPTFRGDEDRSRDAIALNVVLAGLAIYLVLNAVGTMLVYEQKLGAATLVLAALVVILLARHQMRRGRVYLASAALVTGVWLTYTAEIVFSGGAYSAGALSYAFVCVVAGLLLGPRVALGTLTASSVVLVTLAAAQETGHPPPQFFPTRPAALLLFYILFLVLFVGMLAFHSVQHALDIARAAELEHRRVIEQAVDGIIVTDEAGVALFANSALCDLLGRRENEIRGLDILQTYLPADREIGLERLRRVGAGEKLRFERTLQRRDGSTLQVEVTASRLDDGRHQAVIRDVTAHHRAEQAVRESEERFRRLAAAAFEGVAITDGGVIVDVNPRFTELLGYEQSELVGKPVIDLVAPEHQDLVLRHNRSGSMDRYEHTAITKDGRRVPVEVAGRTIPFEGRALRVTAVRDMSDRYRSEAALLRSEEQYRAVFDGVRDVIFALSPDGAITALNAAFEEITGWTRDEWVGKPFVGLLHADDVAEAMALLHSVLHDQPRPTAQLRVWTRGGQLVVGEFRTSVQRKDGVVVGVLGIVRDITGRLQLEDQLRQAQKMEAVGQLAGGVAHDFNNLLTVISSYSQLLLMNAGIDERMRAEIEHITNAADRAAALTRQLLAFSRRQVLQPKVVSLNAVVAGAESLLRRLIGEDVTLVTHRQPHLGAVRADEGQLNQVVVNLAVNARDAMPEGGTLTIETADVTIAGDSRPPDLALVPPGDYVRLSVGDTGIGMDAATKARVFEPFFTTKPEGKGTGLGLATVYGIVQQSSGYIAIASEPHRGTTVSVYLPRVDDAVASGDDRPARAAAPRGTETILLVEDEPGVRMAASELLRIQGYSVIDASDGVSAIRAASKTKGPISLLITDVVMPKLSGPALAEQLAAHRPGLKVLFVSGYADNTLLKHGVLEAGIHFLQKPFKLDALAIKVREILDGPAG
ncbi:MAG TPA: PAS domain S-box protein [Gemmatimonadaceae bacterium]|nr:PAS domain S-box protein [Gemmatimonadaceae bacterium]